MVIIMSKNGLILGRALFTLIIIVSFGIIILNEKGGTLFLSKAKNNINTYIDENYSQIKDNIKIESVKYKDRSFTAKIVSKDNKNLYFYITYKDKKITDTYKKDYLEGNSYLTYIDNKLEDTIYNKTNQKCKVKAISTLDNYTETVRENILKENDLLTLKYYYIEKELQINEWNAKEISDEITKYISLNLSNNITPKYYRIIITDSKDVTKSIEISNITEEFINNNNEQTINDIINKNKSTELNNSKIEYKYLNE